MFDFINIFKNKYKKVPTNEEITNTKNQNLLNEKLLDNEKYSILVKTINGIKLFTSDKVRITKCGNMSMVIESFDLILCQIKNKTLYIVSQNTNRNEVKKLKKYFCCFNNYLPDHEYIENLKNSSDKSEYSRSWKITGFFIINSIESNEFNIFEINDGFDKSLNCIKNGDGKILISGGNFVNVDCKVNGNGTIQLANSESSTFNCEINGDGSIKTSKIKKMFKCKINGAGKIMAFLDKKCKINSYLSKNSKLDTVKL